MNSKERAFWAIAVDRLLERLGWKLSRLDDAEKEPTQFLHIDGRQYALLNWDDFEPGGVKWEHTEHGGGFASAARSMQHWRLGHALVKARDSLDAHCLEAFANNGEKHTISLVLEGPALYHGEGSITRISVEGANRYYIDISGAGALRREDG